MDKDNQSLIRQDWKTFKESGLLWFINTILHTFGYAIAINVDNLTGEITDVYPARTKFRGFSEKSNTAGYIKVSKYLNDNIADLLKEAEE